MSRIIKIPNFMPITCNNCGCIYEFEAGDRIEAITIETSKTCFAITNRLECPVCCLPNDIFIIKEEEQ
jgi:rubredoxin